MSPVTSPLKSPNDPTGLLRAVAETSTPVYIYEASVLRRQASRFRQAISPLSGKLLYALKANSNPGILRVLRPEVDGVEAVSEGEVSLALRLGFHREHILYSPNNIDVGEMRRIGNQGVLFNIGELSLLEQFGRQFPGTEVCIRLNLWIGAGHHKFVVTGGPGSKFGIPSDDMKAALTIAQDHDLRIGGVHQHIGSGFSQAGDFLDAVGELLEVCSQFPHLRFVNVGGGIGVPYRSTERPFDLDTVGRGIKPRVERVSSKRQRPIEVWFEPGRYLVAESGTLVVTVTSVKTVGTKIYAGTDSGFNHLIRPTLYGAYHAVYNLSNPTGRLKRYEIAGNICESGDLFASDRLVQEIREGDQLAILDTGAYGMAMASEYNLRPLPPELLLEEDGSVTILRKPQSARELIDRHLRDTTG